MKIKQMIATIQIYIHHMKGVEVNITPILPKELPLLMIAYGVAKKWVDANITIIQ